MSSKALNSQQTGSSILDKRRFNQKQLFQLFILQLNPSYGRLIETIDQLFLLDMVSSLLADDAAAKRTFL